MQDLYLQIMLIKAVVDTFDSPRFYTTPLGVYVDLDRKLGFFLIDVIDENTELRLVSYRMFFNGSTIPFRDRIVGSRASKISNMLIKVEISAQDLIKQYSCHIGY